MGEVTCTRIVIAKGRENTREHNREHDDDEPLFVISVAAKMGEEERE